MKNKKTMIIISSVVVVISLIIGIVFLNNKDNVEEKYYIVTFNTDGGTTIDSIKVKENSIINLPENPSKEGFKFLGWNIDGEELKKDMQVTKDITLTAIYSEVNSDKKASEPAETNKSTNKANNEPSKHASKNYTCDEGYKLDGTKCTKTYDASINCPSGSTQINGKCVEVVISKKVADTLICENGMQIPGRNSCQGNRISVDSSSSCESADGEWFSDLGECHTKYKETHKCSSNYLYLSNPGQYNSNIHGESGCYPIIEYNYSCSNPQDKLEGTKCIITVDAKLQ